MKQPHVYMLASAPRGYLYVGVTTDLVQRTCQHRTGLVHGHSQARNIHRLVWFEAWDEIQDAIVREKRLKRWRRDWKFQLVEKANPAWVDL